MFGQVQVHSPAISPMAFTTPSMGPAAFRAPGLGPGTLQIGAIERWGALGPAGDPAMSVQDQMISPAPLVGLLGRLGQTNGGMGTAMQWVLMLGGAGAGWWLTRKQKKIGWRFAGAVGGYFVGGMVAGAVTKMQVGV